MDSSGLRRKAPADAATEAEERAAAACDPLAVEVKFFEPRRGGPGQQGGAALPVASDPAADKVGGRGWSGLSALWPASPAVQRPVVVAAAAAAATATTTSGWKLCGPLPFVCVCV